MNSLSAWLAQAGVWGPWACLALFLVSSFVMIWRLEAMNAGGMEGTVLGTLVMPYCSGIGNIFFAILLARKGGSGTEVLTNCFVNNITNLTLLIGLPTVFWGLNVVPSPRSGGSKKKQRSQCQVHALNRLSLLLSLVAALFFTAAVWALGRKGRLEFSDGLVLVAFFLFWQCFHVFEVLKNNVRQNRSLSWMLPIDLALLAVGACGVYFSTDWLVDWVSKFSTGFVSARHLGWLSGWLMVLPNGLLAFYYAWRGNPEVVYTSQVGDGHICIPLCVGLFALLRPIPLPAFSQAAFLILAGAVVFHMVMVAVFGRLPRPAGYVLLGAYAVFLYEGLGRGP